MLFSAIHTVPCVGRKAQWAIKWIDSARSFSERLVGACRLALRRYGASFSCCS